MAPIKTRRGRRTASEEDEAVLRDMSAAAGTEPDGAE